MVALRSCTEIGRVDVFPLEGGILPKLSLTDPHSIGADDITAWCESSRLRIERPPKQTSALLWRGQ